ncbi:hypothetical protein [Photobacterium minamisatsumaniensis]|uniref:hypothetical protein n=1 Tax=Photobacterium minamisatsumaniensis TaxID=2910233 RepID=UPI003D0F21DC
MLFNKKLTLLATLVAGLLTTNVASATQAASVLDLWTLEDKISTEEVIIGGNLLSTDVEVIVTNIYDGDIGDLPEIDIPKVTAAYTVLYDEKGTMLSSFIQFKSFVHDINEDESKGIESIVDLQIGATTEFVKLCGIYMITHGSEATVNNIERNECDVKIVKNPVDPVNWVGPPTVELYSQLFKEQPTYTEDVGGVTYASSVLKKGETNLFKQYCAAIGPDFKPITVAQAQGASVLPENLDNMPVKTRYWTGDDVDGPLPIPGITWHDTFLIDDLNSISAADVSSYNGYFSCAK